MNIFYTVKMFELVVLFRGNDSFLSFFHSSIAPIAKARVITTRNNQRTDDLNALGLLTLQQLFLLLHYRLFSFLVETPKLYAAQALKF